MKNVLFILCLSLTINVLAQTDEELNKVADYTCECLTNKKLKKNEVDKLELELGLCMMDAVSKTKTDISFTDEEAMTKLGEQVGIRMAGSCPPFMELIGVMVEKDPDEMMNLINEDEAVKAESFQGVLSKINKNQFITLELKAEDGKKHIFYWFEYFEGANILKDNSTFLMDKKLKIEYKEVEYYFPKYEEYLKIKVITKLLKK